MRKQQTLDTYEAVKEKALRLYTQFKARSEELEKEKFNRESTALSTAARSAGAIS